MQCPACAAEVELRPYVTRDGRRRAGGTCACRLVVTSELGAVRECRAYYAEPGVRVDYRRRPFGPPHVQVRLGQLVVEPPAGTLVEVLRAAQALLVRPQDPEPTARDHKRAEHAKRQ